MGLIPAGKMTNYLCSFFSLKVDERSEASRQNASNFSFWREASLRAFSFASLCHF